MKNFSVFEMESVFFFCEALFFPFEDGLIINYMLAIRFIDVQRHTQHHFSKGTSKVSIGWLAVPFN